MHLSAELLGVCVCCHLAVRMGSRHGSGCGANLAVSSAVEGWPRSRALVKFRQVERETPFFRNAKDALDDTLVAKAELDMGEFAKGGCGIERLAFGEERPDGQDYWQVVER